MKKGTREREREGEQGPLYCINNCVFAGSSSTFGKSFDERRDDEIKTNVKADVIRSAAKNNEQLLVV